MEMEVEHMKQLQRRQDGTIMLEATFCMILCLFVIFLLISVGFLLYQKVLVNVVANEIAEQISQTYQYSSMEDMSHIEKNDIVTANLYRYSIFKEGSMKRANQQKAGRLAKQRIDRTSLAKATSDPTVTVTPVKDDIGRLHYEVTVTQEYTFLLGEFLDVMGLGATRTLSATAYARGTDILHYVNNVRFAKFVGTELADKLSILDKSIKLISSIVELLGKVIS